MAHKPKYVKDPQTNQPWIDPSTGAYIDVSTSDGRARLKQLRAERKASEANLKALKAAGYGSSMPVSAGSIQTPGSTGLPSAALTPYSSSCSGACFPNVGWMGPALSAMGAARRWVMSMDPENQLIVAQGQPLLLAHDSPASLTNACALAVQGDGTKNIQEVAWPAVPADTTLTLTAGIKVFGVFVRISNSVLNFKFGTYNFRLLNGATVSGDVFVRVKKLPVEIVMLAITNVSGLASVTTNAAASVLFPLATNPSLLTPDVLYCETLNMRDMGDVITNNGGVLNFRD
jgi:hypothetical protein